MFSFKQPPLFCGEKGETFTFWKGICVGDLEFLHAGLSCGVLSSGAGMCCILAQLLMQALGVRWEVKIGCGCFA